MLSNRGARRPWLSLSGCAARGPWNDGSGEPPLVGSVAKAAVVPVPAVPKLGCPAARPPMHQPTGPAAEAEPELSLQAQRRNLGLLKLLAVSGVCLDPKILGSKISHRIFGHMHRVLNKIYL